eukprot:237674-Chlamydomonas_euryale.AAC.4
MKGWQWRVRILQACTRERKACARKSKRPAHTSRCEFGRLPRGEAGFHLQWIPQTSDRNRGMRPPRFLLKRWQDAQRVCRVSSGGDAKDLPRLLARQQPQRSASRSARPFGGGASARLLCDDGSPNVLGARARAREMTAPRCAVANAAPRATLPALPGALPRPATSATAGPTQPLRLRGLNAPLAAAPAAALHRAFPAAPSASTAAAAQPQLVRHGATGGRRTVARAARMGAEVSTDAAVEGQGEDACDALRQGRHMHAACTLWGPLQTGSKAVQRRVMRPSVQCKHAHACVRTAAA